MKRRARGAPLPLAATVEPKSGSVPDPAVVRIERLAAGGRGVGYLPDGRVVFVRGGLPGDLVELAGLRLASRHAEAELGRLLAPAAARRPPPCPDAARCGGCDFMALPLDVQRALKCGLVREALERVGRIDLKAADVEPTFVEVEGESELGYRARVHLRVDGGRLGLLEARTHRLVEIERCHVCSDALWQDVQTLRRVLAGLGAVDTGLASVEVRHLAGAVRGSAHLRLAPGARRGVALSALCAELARSLAVRVESERVSQTEKLSLPGGAFLYAPIGGFVQVNERVSRALVETVLEHAARLRSRGEARFLDVFAGSGNFSLPLAALGLRGIGVEAAGEAVEAARRAAREQALRAEFRAGDARAELERSARARERFELVVVDPPRAGARGLAPLLAELCSERLVMVSCEPVTLARDLAELGALGWRLEALRLFDMFPGTHHVETLAVLRPERA